MPTVRWVGLTFALLALALPVVAGAQVMAPAGKTLTQATASARCLMNAMVAALSAAGDVFGMHTTLVNPPRAAQRVPVSMVSLSLRPGSRRWTCRSIKPGTTY